MYKKELKDYYNTNGYRASPRLPIYIYVKFGCETAPPNLLADTLSYQRFSAHNRRVLNIARVVAVTRHSPICSRIALQTHIQRRNNLLFADYCAVTVQLDSLGSHRLLYPPIASSCLACLFFYTSLHDFREEHRECLFFLPSRFPYHETISR